ncbi:hypothetical protein N7530_009785 [Penicillium desertorum]|uniref:Uncharacterized protein n=1 Tax=Penicillium desertorum TaxID=1303715 RepID=A0A9W9WJ41_9EURO|nr:hypothetical protein N7530_009785 [Penicillium desertorum]
MASNNDHWPPHLYAQPFNTLAPGPSFTSYPLSESIIKHPLGTGAMTEQSYVQVNCYEPQPASPQAGENVGFHQNPDEYGLANHTIGFHGQEATFSNMQKSFMWMAIPRQAVPKSCK